MKKIKKITKKECYSIACDLINGYYEKVVFFSDEVGNQEWNVGQANDNFPDSIVEFSYTAFYDSTKTILGNRMYDSINMPSTNYVNDGRNWLLINK